MKTLTTSQEAARLASSKDVYYFLQIDWPAPVGTRYYSERAFSPDPLITTEPILLGFPEFQRSIDLEIDPKIQIGEATLSFMNQYQDENRLETVFELLETIYGVQVTPYMVFKPAGGAIVRADWISLGLFQIHDYDIETDRITMQLKDWIYSGGRKVLGRFMLQEDWPDSPASSHAKVIPWIFGHVYKAVCYLTDRGKHTTLRTDLAKAGTVVPVLDASAFPASGTVMIGGELIGYTARDLTPGAQTLGTAGAPVVRGAAALDHSVDTTVRQKLPVYRFMVCDHAIKGINEVMLDDVIIAPAAWSVVDGVFDGHAVTYLDITALPLVGSGSDKRYLNPETMLCLAEIEGIVDPYAAPSQAIRLPGHIIRYLINDADFLNLSLDYLDTVALDAALAALGGVWRFDRRIFRQESVLDLLASAVWNAGIHLVWQNGRFWAFPSLPTEEQTSLEVLDAADLMGSVKKEYFHDKYVINRIDLFYDQTYGSDHYYNGEVETQDVLSQGESWGVRSFRLYARWITDATTAANLASVFRVMHGWKRGRVTLDGPLAWAPYELGDVVTLNDAQSNLYNITGVITAVSLPAPDQVRFQVTVVDTIYRIWEKDASNYIALFRGHSRMIFVLGGVPVARLDSNGILYLAGQVTEAPFVGNVTQTPLYSATGLVEYDASKPAFSFALPVGAPSGVAYYNRINVSGPVACAATGWIVSGMYNGVPYYKHPTLDYWLQNFSSGVGWRIVGEKDNYASTYRWSSGALLINIYAAGGSATGTATVTADTTSGIFKALVRVMELTAAGNLLVSSVSENPAYPLLRADSTPSNDVFAESIKVAGAVDVSLNKLNTIVRLSPVAIGSDTNAQLLLRGVREYAQL